MPDNSKECRYASQRRHWRRMFKINPAAKINGTIDDSFTLVSEDAPDG